MTHNDDPICTVYAPEDLPESWERAIFLAGPTPRSSAVPSWRPKALNILRDLGYRGVVFIPETRDGGWRHDYTDQVAWEERCLHASDCVVFWVPRAMQTMPALTTNVEWGVWCDSGRVVFGAPEEAVKVRYLQHYADAYDVPSATTLRATLQAACAQTQHTALRRGGERFVPLRIWHSTPFQSWYTALCNAGNRLDGARVEWIGRGGPKRTWMFCTALRVRVWVAAEERWKGSEVVISRPDIAAVVAFHRTDSDTSIVLVREFRSAGATSDGFVHELPGGSPPSGEDEDPQALAREELGEETGVWIDSDRFRHVGARQCSATLLSHRAHVFSVELTRDELEQFHARQGQVFGVDSSERTHVEIWSLHQLMTDARADWSVLGMVAAALRAT